jgi:surface protein
MFVNCDRFNADLSKWDVRKITAMPDNFCTGRPTLLTFALQPVWGTWPLLPASLSALVFNSNVLSLSPTFLTGSLDYTATFVASAVLPYTVTLTPTAYSASSTITVNGNSVTSGSPINLVFGIGSINTITIVLVNGSNTCTYIVTFPSLLSKSMTALSAYNTTNSASTQRFQMNLDNTSLTSPIMQSFQDISQNALGYYTSNAVNQRFIFGSCVPNNPLELNSTVNAGGSTITSSVKASNFLMYSDVRLKQNIEGLSETQGIDNIRAVQYNNKNDDSKHFGVIAQELAEIYPELVHSDEKNMQSVSYIELIPICINEIQLLKKRQDALQLRLNTVRSRIIQLKN